MWGVAARLLASASWTDLRPGPSGAGESLHRSHGALDAQAGEDEAGDPHGPTDEPTGQHQGAAEVRAQHQGGGSGLPLGVDLDEPRLHLLHPCVRAWTWAEDSRLPTQLHIGLVELFSLCRLGTEVEAPAGPVQEARLLRG